MPSPINTAEKKIERSEELLGEKYQIGLGIEIADNNQQKKCDADQIGYGLIPPLLPECINTEQEKRQANYGEFMRDIEGVQLRPEERDTPVGLFHGISPAQKMPEELGKGLGITPIQERISHCPDRQMEMDGETDQRKGDNKDYLLDAAEQSPIHGKDQKSKCRNQQHHGLMGAKGEPPEKSPEVDIGWMVFSSPVFVAPQEYEIKNHRTEKRYERIRLVVVRLQPEPGGKCESESG